MNHPRSVHLFLVVALFASVLLIPGVATAASATVTDIPNPDAYTCSQAGYIDFETLTDGTNLSVGAIGGVQFTTTNGYTWQVGDFATGNYNGKYPNGAYTSQGMHWAWLGVTQGSGRIDFVNGAASVFSLLTSAETPVSLEAYSAKNILLATAGPSPSNTNTGHMTELKITRDKADLAYVIVHDTGNFFVVDSICTDAPGVVTSEEDAFRRDLEAQAAKFPIQKLQKLGFFGIGAKGQAWSGLLVVLANLCIENFPDPPLGMPTAETICAASKQAKGATAVDAFNTLVELTINAGLGAFEPYSLGGKTLLASTKVFVAGAFADDPHDATVRAVASEALAPMYGRFVGKYVGGLAADATIGTLLKDDRPITGEAPEEPIVTPFGTLVKVKTQFVYNPYTHYVIAFLSSDQQENTVVVVYYEVGKDGQKLPNSTPIVRVFTN